jgi:hypothetical protein
LWKARRYKGDERYQVVELGLANDVQEAAPPRVLDFAQAVRAAHAYVWDAPAVRRRAGGPTVGDVIEDYIAWLKDYRSTAHDSAIRAKNWILPRLGSKRVSELTTEDISSWLRWVAESPALIRGGHRKARPNDDESKRKRRATANRILRP